MGKKIVFAMVAVLMVLTLFGGAVAFAAPVPPAGTQAEGTNKAQLQAFKAEVAPAIAQAKGNTATIKDLRLTLKAKTAIAKTHIAELRANGGKLTADQLAQLKSLTASIKAARGSLAQTRTAMEAARQHLKTARQNKDYASIKAAYGEILAIQQQRIGLLHQLIDLFVQVAQV
jgi:chromosome segregation ATPase